MARRFGLVLTLIVVLVIFGFLNAADRFGKYYPAEPELRWRPTPTVTSTPANWRSKLWIRILPTLPTDEVDSDDDDREYRLGEPPRMPTMPPYPAP
jgi:hypothetical protein